MELRWLAGGDDNLVAGSQLLNDSRESNWISAHVICSACKLVWHDLGVVVGNRFLIDSQQPSRHTTGQPLQPPLKNPRG